MTSISQRTASLVLVGATCFVVGGCAKAQQRIREATGTESHQKASNRVDLNNASQKQLSRLSGLTDDDAARIVANRPYQAKRDLVRRGVLNEQKFDKIADDVYVSQR